MIVEGGIEEAALPFLDGCLAHANVLVVMSKQVKTLIM